MLVTVRDRVAKLKKSGQTLPQVVAAAPTKDLDATWGKGFMRPATSSRSSTTTLHLRGRTRSEASKSASDLLNAVQERGLEVDAFAEIAQQIGDRDAAGFVEQPAARRRALAA